MSSDDNVTLRSGILNKFLSLKEASKADPLAEFKVGVAAQVLDPLLYKEVEVESQRKASARSRPPRLGTIAATTDDILNRLESLKTVDDLVVWAKTKEAMGDKGIIYKALAFGKHFTQFPAQGSNFVNYLDYGQLCQTPSVSDTLMGRMTVAAIELGRADLLELAKSRAGVAVIASVPPVSAAQARAGNVQEGYRPMKDRLNLMGHFFPSAPLAHEMLPLTDENVARLKSEDIYGAQYLQASTIEHAGKVGAIGMVR